MKIVHVLSPLTKGGGEKVAVELSNLAAEEGNDVTVITAYPVDPTLLENSISKKVNVRYVQSSGKCLYLRAPYWIWLHRKWLKNIDILHCHLSYGSVFGLWVVILSKFWGRRKPKVVETYHAVGMSIPKLNRLVHSFLALSKDAFILMAEDDYWNNFIRKNRRLHTNVIRNGISIKKVNLSNVQINEIKKNIGIPPTCKIIVGTIGMLRKDREPLRYIPIFEKVFNSCGPSVHFIIGGGGPELETLKEAIKEKRLEEQIHLTGLVTNPFLIYPIIDIYISLNVGSTTGISVLEAAVSGLPVIAIQMLSDYNATCNDWIWSSNNENEIVDKIKELVSSADQRSKTASFQKKYVLDNFSSDKMYKKYKELYEELLKPSIIIKDR